MINDLSGSDDDDAVARCEEAVRACFEAKADYEQCDADRRFYKPWTWNCDSEWDEYIRACEYANGVCQEALDRVIQ